MGIRVAVVDDNPHLSWEGQVYPANATFHRFLSAVLDVPGPDGRPFVDRIDHCVPLREADRQPATLALDPRLNVIGTAPFDGIAGFARHAPSVVRHNRPILRAAIGNADLAWIKVPASNGPLAGALARSASTPCFVWVAGSAHEVARGQGRTGFGGGAALAARALGAGYDLAGRAVGLGGDRLVVGAGFVDGSGIVASLVEPDELRDPAERAWPAIPWRLRLAWAGRLVQGKGLGTVLEAVAALDREDRRVELVVLGDGPLAGQLTEHAVRLGVGERIHWLGYVAERGPYLDALSACDMFVFPSPAEGFPKAVLDAMAVGLPVVAAPSGQLAPLARDGYVEPVRAGDGAGLAATIERLTGDPAGVDALRRRGFELAAKHTRPAEAARVVARWRARWPDLAWG